VKLPGVVQRFFILLFALWVVTIVAGA